MHVENLFRRQRSPRASQPIAVERGFEIVSAPFTWQQRRRSRIQICRHSPGKFKCKTLPSLDWARSATLGPLTGFPKPLMHTDAHGWLSPVRGFCPVIGIAVRDADASAVRLRLPAGLRRSPFCAQARSTEPCLPLGVHLWPKNQSSCRRIPATPPGPTRVVVPGIADNPDLTEGLLHGYQCG